MVKFSESTVETTKRAMQYVREHKKELQPRTITVQLEKQDDFLSCARRPGSDLVWFSDEAKERGGQGKAASPLSYLLSSMGFCQFVHYTEHSIVDNIKLDFMKMKIDGKISMQRPRRFTEITYEVEIASSESDQTIMSLGRKAADDCYVTNTLKRACTVIGIVMHNGKKIDEHH